MGRSVKDVELAVPSVVVPSAGYKRPSVLVKTGMVVTHLIFSVFIFGLPLWSMLLHDIYADKCRTPANEIACGNGANYTELVLSLGLDRTKNGQMYGCGCGQ